MQITAIDFDLIPEGTTLLASTIVLEGATTVEGTLDVQGSLSSASDIDTGGGYRINGQSAFSTGSDASNVLLGTTTGTGGFGSVYIGYLAGQDSTTTASDRNVFVGSEAGARNLNGRKNVYIGEEAGKGNTMGSGNVMIGENAGFNNMGDGNVFLGQEAGEDETGSNKLYIANSDTSTPLVYGEFTSKTLQINDVLRLAPRSSPPANPTQGTIYYDSDGALCVYSGSGWDRIGSGNCQ